MKKWLNEVVHYEREVTATGLNMIATKRWEFWMLVLTPLVIVAGVIAIVGSLVYIGTH